MHANEKAFEAGRDRQGFKAGLSLTRDPCEARTVVLRLKDSKVGHRLQFLQSSAQYRASALPKTPDQGKTKMPKAFVKSLERKTLHAHKKAKAFVLRKKSSCTPLSPGVDAQASGAAGH